MKSTKLYPKILILAISVIFSFFFSRSAEAAVLYVDPPAKNIPIGQEFTLDIKVNTESISINAAQAVIHFPSGIITAIGTDKVGSAFNFWVEEPVVSSDNGKISFIGGTPKGVSGNALQLLRVKFKATGVGAADITLSEAVVTASDGKGTDTLSRLDGARVVVSGAQVAPPPLAPNIPKMLDVPKIEAPKPVERVAVVAKKLPNQPQISVPLYPDPLKWYSHVGDVVVFWEVPDDIIAIATKLDHSPNTDPSIVDKELFTGKNFGSVEEGIWYAHVQFKNNVGWGPAAHYKISIDRAVPAAFDIKIDNPITENPTPVINYETSDALSGLSEIGIFIDAGDPIKVAATSTSFVLPPQPPGKHRIVVRATDGAGNAVEDDQDLEILPLAKPSIDFITKSVSQEEIIFVSGKSAAGGFVDVVLKNSDGVEEIKVIAVVDSSGGWKANIEKFIPLGVYSIVAVARDNRGALSYSTDPIQVKVKPKTIISFGSLDLGAFELIIFGLLMVVVGAGLIYWYFVRARNRRGIYRTIVVRDVEKLSVMILEDLKSLESLLDKTDSTNQRMVTMKMAKLKDTANKMRKYLSIEIEKLK